MRGSISSYPFSSMINGAPWTPGPNVALADVALGVVGNPRFPALYAGALVGLALLSLRGSGFLLHGNRDEAGVRCAREAWGC